MEKEKIVKRDVVEIMKESYIDYAMSVIVSRALPDVRDGLKPVQRRILYTMYEMGLKHNAKFRKSASIVGECFVKDTLVLTKRGLIPIQEIKVGDLVYTQKGLRKVIRLYRMPQKPLLKVTLENGISNIVTPSQKFKVLAPNWEFEWKEAKDLTTNDFLLIKADYSEINNYVKLKKTEKNQPLYLNEDIAYLLGLFISNGWISKDYSKKKLPKICFKSGPCREVAEKVVSIFKKEFNYTPTIEIKSYPFLDKEGRILNNKIHLIRINRKKINEFFISNFSLKGVWGKTKIIPKQVFSSPKSVIFSFVSGLIEGDGYLSEKRNLIHYGSISEKLIDQLMILLLSQGIFSEKYPRKNLKKDFLLGEKIKNKHKYYYLEIRGKNATKLASLLEMLANPEKKKRAIKIANNKKRGDWSKYELLPYAGKILFQELSENHLGGGWYQDVNEEKFRMGIKYPVRKTQVISWGIKNKLERIGSPFFDFLKEIIENKIYFLRVTSIKKVAPRKTYDLEVELDHEFVANGVISHNCLGKYHPHGDAPVYEALVRMAQDFSLRYPLILGQGNFGSIDDPSEFAAMRYTEAKLSKIGEEMLKDIEKETVDFGPNYDGTRSEPLFSPSPLPQLLLNGSLGIAVGMATSIPPHNLNEIIDALILMLKKERISLDEILKLVKGPDFPTGGELYFNGTIKEIYQSGQGQLIIRAKTKIEEGNIIVTEIPYLVKKSDLLLEIAERIKEGKISGIKLIRDESDREGVRILIEPQKGISPHSLLEILYQNTSLQKTFNVNFVVLVSGIQPKLVGLLEILRLFLEHRKEVVLRRTKYELRILKEQLHILEGIKRCLGKIDEVIKIIKKSVDRRSAQKKLMEEFSLDEIQANAILETRLASLAKMEREKIEKDFREKQLRVKELSGILKNPKRVREIIERELKEIKEKFGDKRKTEIKSERIKIKREEELILPEETVVILDKNKNLKRMVLSLQKLPEKRRAGIYLEKEEILKSVFTNTQNQLLLFSNQGRAFKIPVFQIPEKKGRAIFGFCDLKEEEEISEILDLKKGEEGEYLFFSTKEGVIKKLKIESLKNIKRKGLKVISLKKDDLLCSVLKTSGKNILLLATARGQIIAFKEKELREMGRGAEGVKGMRLKKDDFLVSMIEIEDLKRKDFSLLFCSEKGFLKRVPLKEFKIQKRGGTGIRGIKISEKTGSLVFVKLHHEKEDLILFSKKKIFKIKISQVPKLKRGSQGKKMIKLEEGDGIVSGILV